MGHGLAKPSIIPLRNSRLLNVTVYVALASIVAIGLALIPSLTMQIATAVLCLGFGLVDTLWFGRVASLTQAAWYFSVQTLLVVGLFAASRVSDPFNFLLFVLSIQATSLLPLRQAMVWNVVFFLVSAGAALLLRGEGALINILFNASAFVFTGVYGYTLRQVELARRQNEWLLAELRETQRQLHELAVTEERNRLARELHDSVKQQAFALSAQLDAARSRIRQNPEAAERHLVQAEQLADSLRQELSGLIFDLRPPALSTSGLASALRSYLEQWSQHTGIAAELTVSGTGGLPSALEAPLLRIAQEALSNVSRHSEARQVRILLLLAPDKVQLELQDDGRGFMPAHMAPGVGLESMRERAAALPGGSFSVESRPGEGTRVTVWATLEGDGR